MIKNIKFDDFKFKDQVKSYYFGGSFCPGVWEDKENHIFQIRIGKCKRVNFSNIKVEYAYFELDKTGLIISSPHGLSKEYTKKVRITDIELIVKNYKGGNND